MPRFRYVGKNLRGDLVEGTMLASDQADLEMKLVDSGVFVQSHRPALGHLQQQFIKRLRSAEITRVTRQLQILLKSRISVVEALQLVSEQIKDRNLRSVFESIIAQVETGKALAEAFGDYPILFDDLYTSMIEAGESSGKLDFAFENIASYREKHEATARKVKSVLAYPLVVILVAVLVVSALILYVVPVFSSMYENFNAELPALTQSVVGLSNSLRDNIGYYILGIILLGASGVAVVVTSRFRYYLHMSLVRMPVLRNLTIKLVSARFCRTIGTLLTSGVDILLALQIAARTTGNSYVAATIEPAGLQLVEGKSFTEAIESTRLFPKAVLRLSASGEKTGQLGEMLTRAADYYESEADAEIATLTTLLEPLLIVLLGVFVAFILIAMYLPLFDLVGAM